MKKLFTIIASVVLLAVSCEQIADLPRKKVVVLNNGAVELNDTHFSMYYGNLGYTGVGIFTVVVSDAKCYQDVLNFPYMDSEGDMLVLRLRTELLAEGAALEIPLGVYELSADGTGIGVFDLSGSYVKRFVGNTQSKWDITEGRVIFEEDMNGNCIMYTEGMKISRAGVQEEVEYVCNSDITVSDFLFEAPKQLGFEDDIIDLPFADIDYTYYGDLYSSGTGNFVVNFYTKGLVNDVTGKLAGIYVTLPLFTKYFEGKDNPELSEGVYTVANIGTELFQPYTLLPGMLYESSPFGSYIAQQLSTGEGTYEFITDGTVKVSYESNGISINGHDVLVLEYDLKTSSRKIKGTVKIKATDMQNEGGEVSSGATLTTLTGDVVCDMSKVTEARFTYVETLHRKITRSVPDGDTGKYKDVDEGYDIAEAWRLYLEPRDWTDAEEDIPWVDPVTGGPWDRGYYEDESGRRHELRDKDGNSVGGNGIHDRIDIWCCDGDVMVLEFILPLNSVTGHSTAIAKEIGVEYKYILQPQLDMVSQKDQYEGYVSSMGRPMDEVFDPDLVAKTPDWADVNYSGWVSQLGIQDYGFCARRGFTWASDGFRGNWYLHYKTKKHQILDGQAQAINGFVKVKRVSEDRYDFSWEFTDDYPNTPNTISGEIKNCLLSIVPKK